MRVFLVLPVLPPSLSIFISLTVTLSVSFSLSLLHTHTHTQTHTNSSTDIPLDPQVDDMDVAEMMINMGYDTVPHTTKIKPNPQHTSPPSSSSSSARLEYDYSSFGMREKYPGTDPRVRDSLTLLEDGRDDSNAWVKKTQAQVSAYFH